MLPWRGRNITTFMLTRAPWLNSILVNTLY
nr:MAG TPA: hypothetical protein [Caudoviricetes sp.]